jgi:hypothetical protein
VEAKELHSTGNLTTSTTTTTSLEQEEESFIAQAERFDRPPSAWAGRGLYLRQNVDPAGSMAMEMHHPSSIPSKLIHMYIPYIHHSLYSTAIGVLRKEGNPD